MWVTTTHYGTMEGWVVILVTALAALTRPVTPIPVGEKETCHTPVGLASDALNPLVDFELAASDGNASNVRLNGPSSWKVHSLNNEPFVQVTLSKPMLITGIQTQGDPDESAWVVQFRVAYSRDCEAYTSGGSSYWANINNNTTLTHFFHNLTLAKCMRIFPTQHEGSFSALRLELLGCDIEECTNKLNVYSSEVIPPEIGDQPGVLIKLTSETILTSLAVTYEARAHDEVQLDLEYSRSCVNYTAVHNGQVTQLYRSPEDSPRQVSVIAFYTPVRAQCVRVTPVGRTVLESVKPYGCDATITEGTFAECGRTRKTSGIRRKRVVGGDPVTPGDWPWLVSMHFLKWHNFTNSSGLRHLCGASLIGREWILSAAHCFDPDVFDGLDDPDNWRVALGEHDQSSADGTEQLMEVESITTHPNFTISNDGPILFDIALLKLKQPAVLSDYVNMVCLDRVGDFPPGSRCIVSGWGQDTTDTPGTKLPFMTFLPIMEADACRDKYNALPEDHMARTMVRVDDSVFCAATETGGQDACYGDSGGPFICEKDDQWYQVGIVSLGYICGDLQYPGVYTKVAHYRDWIDDIISNYNYTNN
ncbi:uncharacterized protein LOC124138544 [Haliotis rufescens]|uniref:uncharacterized protein LOC124138544 n=1 Tax=Haliotis rufescens TaxID=6454 RepID=UPI001EB02BF6|nr:uncharacterized protein LOC124138544 [Haliotis rufescens]